MFQLLAQEEGEQPRNVPYALESSPRLYPPSSVENPSDISEGPSEISEDPSEISEALSEISEDLSVKLAA